MHNLDVTFLKVLLRKVRARIHHHHQLSASIIQSLNDKFINLWLLFRIAQALDSAGGLEHLLVVSILKKFNDVLGVEGDVVPKVLSEHTGVENHGIVVINECLHLGHRFLFLFTISFSIFVFTFEERIIKLMEVSIGPQNDFQSKYGGELFLEMLDHNFLKAVDHKP